MLLNTGNKYRNLGEWFLLTITLIDGHEINVVTADVVVVEDEEPLNLE